MKIKKNQGITLISLAITIIIMLILVGVVLSLSIGEHGIFKTAQGATKNYTDAQNKELADLNEFDKKIEGILGEVTKENEIPENALKKVAKVGDYIEYKPTEKSFTINATDTGYDSNQTYSTGTYTGLWQVLYNDEEHGLQIVSEDVVVNSLYIGNATDLEKMKIGYNNLVSILDGFCENYVNPNYAVKGRCVGSNSSGTNRYYENSELTWFSEYSGQFLEGVNYNSNDTDILFSWVTGDNLKTPYWVAAYQEAYVYPSKEEVEFSTTGVHADWSTHVGIIVFQVRKDGGMISDGFESAGVRPIITLKNNIEQSEGNGTKDNPYKLVSK